MLKYWVVKESGIPWCWEMTTDEGAHQMLRTFYQRCANSLSDGSTPEYTLHQLCKSEFDELKLEYHNIGNGEIEEQLS